MQLSESLLLHWRHWMRSVNDTAREAFQCKRYLCSSACAQLTCVSPCAAVVIFAGLGVSEHTDSSTYGAKLSTNVTKITKCLANLIVESATNG